MYHSIIGLLQNPTNKNESAKINRLFLQVLAIAALLLAFVRAQEYDDYEQQSAPSRPAPPRTQPGYSGPVAKQPPVAILKQINR